MQPRIKNESLLRRCSFFKRAGLIASLCAFLTLTWCQSPATTQLQTVQAQARTALLATAQPTSVVLNGTFASTAGSLAQNGSAQLTVGSDGTFAVNLSGSAGATGESRTVSDGIPSCTWTDHESVVHNSLFLNCLPPAWFFPGLTLLSVSSDPSLPAWTPSSYAVDSLGDHLQFQFVLPNSTAAQEDPQMATPFDLVLAPDTQLPLYALFTAHPDNPWVHAEIQVKIAYSDYRSISGVMIPFRIQRYLNGSLVLDLTITSASVQ
jgi:hypothetical protein